MSALLTKTEGRHTGKEWGIKVGERRCFCRDKTWVEKQKCSTLHPLQRIGQEPCQLKRNVECSEETKQKEKFKTFQNFLVFCVSRAKEKKK